MCGYPVVCPLRPDIVDCWIFRVGEASPGVGPGGPAAGSTPPGAEILLLRRAPSRILPGLWQCVSGSLEPGERIALGALRELRDRIEAEGIPRVEMEELSMGMTGDYAVAVEEGATIVRIGRGIFGERGTA